MNKEEKSRLIRIAFLSLLLGLIIGTIIGFGVGTDNSKHIELKEDYDWLKESSIDCWNRLRVLDNHCWSPTDCFDNPNLEGCEEGVCGNWACCNKNKQCETTLIGCSS